jgi:hypothetical protein
MSGQEQGPLKEKIIDVSSYKRGNTIITCYTGSFCNPCKRIKPEYLDYFKKNGFVEDELPSVLLKSQYNELGPEYKLVPFFVLKTENSIEKIQTSRIDELIEFIEKKSNGILDDF